jgi:hypothetical protein
MGAELYPADEGNPKGYFEDREVNGINEGLLAQVVPGPARSLADKLLGRPVHNPGWFRWLAALPTSQNISCHAKFAERIAAQIAHQPFCFKDPRFCYTLAAWRRFAAEAAMICVFRDPAISAASIVKEAERSGMGPNGGAVDHAHALNIWYSSYTYALDVHLPAGGDWIFVHYDQLMDGSGYDAIEKLLGVKVDRSFADRGLRRTVASAAVPPPVDKLYRRLCDRAAFSGD